MAFGLRFDVGYTDVSDVLLQAKFHGFRLTVDECKVVAWLECALNIDNVEISALGRNVLDELVLTLRFRGGGELSYSPTPCMAKPYLDKARKEFGVVLNVL